MFRRKVKPDKMSSFNLVVKLKTEPLVASAKSRKEGEKLYINPFVAGVLATVGVEMLLMIAYALIVTRRK